MTKTEPALLSLRGSSRCNEEGLVTTFFPREQIVRRPTLLCMNHNEMNLAKHQDWRKLSILRLIN